LIGGNHLPCDVAIWESDPDVPGHAL
jgi:hypothetical protein